MTNGRSYNPDSSGQRRYFNVFPNLTVGHKFKTGLLSAAYARRIGRPNYDYLNPFRIVRGAYSAFEGNPYLRPAFTDSYRLSYTHRNKLSFTASYSKVSDVITDLSLIDERTKVHDRT